MMRDFLLGFPGRAKAVIHAALVLLDVIGCFLWIAPLHLVNLASRPTGRQMISAYIGRAALNGHRWARIAAWPIDRLFRLLDGRGEHCLRMAEKFKGFAD